jgi:hypothetical protein
MTYFIYMQDDEVFGLCFAKVHHHIYDGEIGIAIINSDGQLQKIYLGRATGGKVDKGGE